MKMKFPLLILMVGFLSAACTPTVQVQAPDKPIEINLNVKIEQEVRVRVERDLENLFEEDPELFGVPASE
ncbi:MAG: YnbE family lipoprotein [Pseudomonadota bacterium]